MSQKIEITIKRDGSLEYTVQCVKWRGCKELTSFIDKLSKVVETKTTPEYYQVETNNERERN